MLTRLSLAQQMTRDYGDDGGFSFDANRFTTDQLIALLLDGKSDRRLQQAMTGLSLRETAALLLASPSYQLA